MRDLNTHIVEQQAAHWERLGLELGLKDYQIGNISRDNEHNPNRSITCCRAVLERWLQEIPSPTWDKLDDALNNIHSTTSGSRGMHKMPGRYLNTIDLKITMLAKSLFSILLVYSNRLGIGNYLLSEV